MGDFDGSTKASLNMSANMGEQKYDVCGSIAGSDNSSVTLAIVLGVTLFFVSVTLAIVLRIDVAGLRRIAPFTLLPAWPLIPLFIVHEISYKTIFIFICYLAMLVFFVYALGFPICRARVVVSAASAAPVTPSNVSATASNVVSPPHDAGLAPALIRDCYHLQGVTASNVSVSTSIFSPLRGAGLAPALICAGADPAAVHPGNQLQGVDASAAFHANSTLPAPGVAGSAGASSVWAKPTVEVYI